MPRIRHRILPSDVFIKTTSPLWVSGPPRLWVGRAASLLASWLARLSVCLQRENAACFRSSVGLASMASLPGACGWEDEVEGLLLQAAAFATAVA